jgi:hypothetical protein
MSTIVDEQDKRSRQPFVLTLALRAQPTMST